MNLLAVRIGVGLAALFGLGISTGVVVAKYTTHPARPAVHGTGLIEDKWLDTRLEDYRKRLDLTPEQVAAIRPHFQKMAADMKQVRAEVRKKFAASMKEVQIQMARELTPAQREKMSKLARDKKEGRLRPPFNPNKVPQQ